MDMGCDDLGRTTHGDYPDAALRKLQVRIGSILSGKRAHRPFRKQKVTCLAGIIARATELRSKRVGGDLTGQRSR